MSDDEDMGTGRDSEEEEFEFSYSDDDMSQAEAVELVEEKVGHMHSVFYTRCNDRCIAYTSPSCLSYCGSVPAW